MKRVLKWLGGIIGVIILLIVIASIAVYVIVDKPFIEKQMRGALHRHATIGDISVGIFSVISGIEVKDVKISNFKTEKQLTALEGKPVPAGDLFVGLKAFKFKVQFLPLLQKQFVLKELTLYEPKINVIKNEKGVFNFDDLLVAKPMTAEEKAEAEKEAREEAKRLAEEAKNPSKPLTVDDIPIAVNVGKIGIEKATITYEDKQFQQTFQIYDLTALVHSIDIDGKALDKKNQVKINVDMGIKTMGQMKTGTVQSFDILLSIKGSVKPFDVKTRRLDPEVTVKMGSPKGTLTGLQILEKAKDVEALSKYCGKLNFLGKDVRWKNGYMKVWYKAGTVKIDEGDIKTDDYQLSFKGKTNINTKAVDAELDMVLADKHGKSIRSGIEKNAKKAITGAAGKYVTAEKVADLAMKPLQNKEGKVYLKYQVKGTMSDPKTNLVHPQLPSLGSLVKDAAGSVADAAVDKAKDVAADKAKAAADKGTKKATKKLKKKLF